MLNYLLLVLSMITASGKALFGKVVGRGAKTINESLKQNFLSFVVAFVCSLFFVLGKLKIFTVSSFTLILSVVFALSVSLTQITQSKAMGLGASSIVSLIYSFGFVLPIVFAFIVWGESVSIFQIAGLVLLVVSLVLIVYKKGEKSKRGWAWFILALVAMIGSGTNAILQKIHQRSPYFEELELFLVYATFFSMIFTFIAFLITKRKKNEEQTEEENKPSLLKRLIGPIGLGVCVCALNFVNLYLAGKLPSIIQFPIYNVGNLLLTTVVSAIIFKDKTSVQQKIGLGIGVVAILIIGLL
mgnify:CR=1 FL=1